MGKNIFDVEKPDFYNDYKHPYWNIPYKLLCPVCDERMFIKVLPKYLSVMIVCENEDDCESPWRDDPIDCPYHFWVNFTEKELFLPQRKDDSHINMVEEEEREVFARITILDMRQKHKDVYEFLVNLVKANNGFQNFYVSHFDGWFE